MYPYSNLGELAKFYVEGVRLAAKQMSHFLGNSSGEGMMGGSSGDRCP